MCGGTGTATGGAASRTGLSPRVRGNPGRGRADAGVRGSIPACAGEPGVDVDGQAVAQVYPRVCGGTAARRPQIARRVGLSPRVRGNHRGSAAPQQARGSIPACAGEPITHDGPITPPRVYPRVCGGTPSAAVVTAAQQGLSPRVRGNRRRRPRPAARARSIPACAGEPRRATLPCRRARVYPRVCGGTAPDRPPVSPNRGLSPRVRGNPHHASRMRCVRWSIPACAGEPAPARRRSAA